jgi:5-methylcytosine-specific restriction protein B
VNPQSREQWLMDQLRDERWIDVVIMVMQALGGTAKVADIASHEFVVLKAKALGRIQNIRAQIWASLQAHTVESSATVNYSKRFPPYVFDKQENSVWHFVDGWQDECEEQIQRSKELINGPIIDKPIRRYDFVTFHQAYSYEDFVEGIRPIQDEETGDLVYRVIPGVFRRICQKAKDDPANRYAIFIDEINRGNIARIFGELITLIEIDKRARYSEAGDVIDGMSLTLPYSGEAFSVPANLDIYGSMNTADRSIALLDTALRRRFTFKELMPDSSKISGADNKGFIPVAGGEAINLRALLDSMNRRIRFLLNRDLMLGHAYLCKVQNFAELKDVLLNQLVPLLQEYFYNDWHRIQLVFRDIGENDKRIEPQIIVHEKLSEEDVLGFDHDDFEDLIEYRVARLEDITSEAIRKIYE